MLETVCYPDMDKDLLIYKINKLSVKLNNYFKTVEQNAVDIPDFMKPTEHQRKNLVQAQINKLLREGSLDYWYFKLLEDEENGVRR